MIVILTPVYNDWESFSVLVEKIDEVLGENELRARVVAVNDGSSDSFAGFPAGRDFRAIDEVEILSLTRNFGHQKALAIGLHEISARGGFSQVIVMDADGEDRPEDIPALIERAQESGKIVCARRSKRSEGFLFVFFYHIFKSMFKLATSRVMDFGNFSILSQVHLKKLLFFNEIWSHLPATIMKSRIPYETLSTVRGVRYNGESKMNFVSLVRHGLSGMLVFGDIAGLRAVIASVFLILFCIFFLILLVCMKFFTDWSIPGWTSYLVVLTISVMLQIFTVTLVFTFIFMNVTSFSSIQPVKDFRSFIDSSNILFKRVSE